MIYEHPASQTIPGVDLQSLGFAQNLAGSTAVHSFTLGMITSYLLHVHGGPYIFSCCVL